MVRIIVDDSQSPPADVCPKCGARLKILVSYEREWDMKTFRVFTFMCPACSFKNVQKQPCDYWDYRDAVDGKSPRKR